MPPRDRVDAIKGGQKVELSERYFYLELINPEYRVEINSRSSR